MSAQGALVISLDFELVWGVRGEFGADGGDYRPNLLGARNAIPRLLDLFAEFEISATWATVGMLMAHTREELEHPGQAHWRSFSPSCHCRCK